MLKILDVWYALGAPCGTLCSSTKDLLFGQFVAVVKSFEVTHAFVRTFHPISLEELTIPYS